jgi:hypothetical protein
MKLTYVLLIIARKLSYYF